MTIFNARKLLSSCLVPDPVVGPVAAVPLQHDGALGAGGGVAGGLPLGRGGGAAPDVDDRAHAALAAVLVAPAPVGAADHPQAGARGQRRRPLRHGQDS